MKAAIYARESDDDATKAPPIEKQIERGKKWALENNHEVIIIYQDDGFSGGDWKRPDWNQSINDSKRHLWQILWVWNQDRLARDTEQFLYYYRNLKQSNTRIFEDTSNDYIEMETLGGRVKHQSLAQAAEIFRLVTSEKVKKAYARNLAEGKTWGRKRKNLDTKKIIQLRLTGLGYRSIAKEFPNISYQTIRRMLQNTHTKFNNEITKNNGVTK